jgi:hypothetical protein
MEEAHETLASMARCTGDVTRDLDASTLALVRVSLEQGSEADQFVGILEGKAPRSEQNLSRIFGEQLPSGLVIRENEGHSPSPQIG